MTGRLLLLAAAAYALLSLTNLWSTVAQARTVRDSALARVSFLQSAIAELEEPEKNTEEAARDKLKMVKAGERIILFGP